MFGKKSEKTTRSLGSPNSVESQYHDEAILNRPSRVHTMPPESPTIERRETKKLRNPNRYSGNGSNEEPPRPYLARVPSVRTRYMEMLLHLDQIPRLHNILGSIFTWVILAGFLVVPGTFTSFKNSDTFKNADENDSNKVAHAILHSIANIGLLWVAGALSLFGVLGCLWLWYRWRKNYVWLINRIFLPTLLNSIAGLLTTIVNVYTAQKGVWSVTAKITAIVTSSCAGVAGLLFVLYNFWVLKNVRKTHDREFLVEDDGRVVGPNNRESIMEKVKRKAHEPALQPGSVV